MKPLVKHNTRFNLLDLILTAALLLLLIGAAVYFIPRRATGENAVYTLSFTGMRAEFAERLQEGDLVYDQSGSIPLGSVEHITVEPDLFTVTDPATGEVRTAPYPPDTLCAVRLSVRTTNAQRNETGLTVSTCEIRPDSPLSVRTARVSCTGTCTDITGGEAK